LHYQFIMANDRRARYDYFMLLTGPVPVATWARHDYETLTAFAADATLAEDRVPAVDAADRRTTGYPRPGAGPNPAPSEGGTANARLTFATAARSPLAARAWLSSCL